MVNESGNRRGNPRSKRHGNRDGKRGGPPPSRARYEERNPVVSVRVPADLSGELKVLQEQSGLSMMDILRAGLQRCSAPVGKAHSQGFLEALAILYEAVCIDCRDVVMVLAHNPNDLPSDDDER